MRVIRIAAGVIIVVGSVAACDTTVHQGGTSPNCLAATEHSDFAFIRDVVFESSCVFSSCHGATPQGGLSLTRTRAYGELVGVPADIVEGWTRVVPGDPEHSYLMVKLGAIPGPLGEDGETMPLNNPTLCEEQLDAVRRWIAAGALPD